MTFIWILWPSPRATRARYKGSWRKIETFSKAQAITFRRFNTMFDLELLDSWPAMEKDQLTLNSKAFPPFYKVAQSSQYPFLWNDDLFSRNLIKGGALCISYFLPFLKWDRLIRGEDNILSIEGWRLKLMFALPPSLSPWGQFVTQTSNFSNHRIYCTFRHINVPTHSVVRDWEEIMKSLFTSL